MPLFFALAVVSDGSAVLHLRDLSIGAILLMLGQTISVLFKVGATLFDYFPPETAVDAVCSTECYWAVLYYLQFFSYMLLRTILPVVLWALLYRGYVTALSSGIRDAVSNGTMDHPESPDGEKIGR